MDSEDRLRRWGPVLIGVFAELIVLAFGFLLPISQGSGVRFFVAMGLLNVGVLGGAVTGTLLGHSWRSNARNGLATGIVGGAVFALLLFGTVTKTLPSTRYTGFWTIHYFIATEVPIPSWVVVEYGYLVVGGISFLVGAFVLVESGIAAGAAASVSDTSDIEDW
jgi:hypothetical protein